MTLLVERSLKPRKIPVQSRSAVTLDAIYDAGIQVLLTVGAKRTTTTRVAERAGVSVGTLYQYHSNIQSLMAAVLERHLSEVVAAVETACLAAHGQTLLAMSEALVEAFIDAKLKDVGVARGLYEIALDMNCAAIVGNASARLQKATEEMLKTMSAQIVPDVREVAGFVVLSMTGPVRAMLEAGAPSKMVRNLRKHLVLLVSGYLMTCAEPEINRIT